MKRRSPRPFSHGLFPTLGSWLCVGVLGTAGCDAVTARRATEQVIPVSKGTELRVETPHGAITVEAGRPGHVRLRTKRRVRSVWGADKKLKHIKVEVKKKGGVLHIRATHPGGDTYSAGLHLTVPPDTKLTLKTRRGHLRVSRTTGEVHGSTGYGELVAVGVQGRITLRSGGGNVTLRGQPSAFDLQTKQGRMKLELLPATRLTKESRATTDDGAITFRASPQLTATVTASSTKGRIHSDWPLAVTKPTWVRAELGGAGPDLSLATRRGAVRLERETSWRGRLDAPMR